MANDPVGGVTGQGAERRRPQGMEVIGDPPPVPASERAEERPPLAAAPRYEGTGITAGLVGLLVAGVVVVIVVAQNVDRVAFDFLFWSVEVSLAVLLLVTALVTLALDQVVGVMWRRRRRRLKTLAATQR